MRPDYIEIEIASKMSQLSPRLECVVQLADIIIHLFTTTLHKWQKKSNVVVALDLSYSNWQIPSMIKPINISSKY